MQAWFPMGKPICGPGSCVLPLACWFSEPGLSYIPHCHVDWFPIQNSCYIGTYAVEKSRFSNVSYVAQYKSLFTFLFLLLLLTLFLPLWTLGWGKGKTLTKKGSWWLTGLKLTSTKKEPSSHFYKGDSHSDCTSGEASVLPFHSWSPISINKTETFPKQSELPSFDWLEQLYSDQTGTWSRGSIYSSQLPSG